MKRGAYYYYYHQSEDNKTITEIIFEVDKFDIWSRPGFRRFFVGAGSGVDVSFDKCVLLTCLNKRNIKPVRQLSVIFFVGFRNDFSAPTKFLWYASFGFW